MPIVPIIVRLLIYIGALFAGSLFAKIYLVVQEWLKKRAKDRQERLRSERTK